MSHFLLLHAVTSPITLCGVVHEIVEEELPVLGRVDVVEDDVLLLSEGGEQADLYAIIVG